MPISFHDDKNKYSYTGRHADADWLKLVGPRLPGLKHAADVGCGGGVYSAAFAELRAEAVRGVDFSKAMLD
ncbi:class I SAM-dependent methyltransferase [Paenibacillus filicis]|uniref:Class I SAM-dependent methyltransferase n=1 Tax=Paenibacillus gyeongsangnamensis TaxID=3388067 RepID=A0ABT4Q317_9BACL|nr:class I SAM-dependent methyltransferase [Paenibacillus filicis]MCZ8511279.1 class I SAM-dependent methyltransferase [Paenibacillus filicis]